MEYLHFSTKWSSLEDKAHILRTQNVLKFPLKKNPHTYKISSLLNTFKDEISSILPLFKKKNHENIQCSVIKNPEMKSMWMSKQIHMDVLNLWYQSKIHWQANYIASLKPLTKKKHNTLLSQKLFINRSIIKKLTIVIL